MNYTQEQIISRNDVTAVVVMPLNGGNIYSELAAAMENSPLLPDQTHSLNVRVVDSHEDEVVETDAVVTFRPGLAIGVRTADCVPLVIYAPDVKGVAAIHAGWKGTLGGIVDNTLDVLEKHGAKPEEMIVAFGPSVSQKVYEVDRELGKRFMNTGFEDYVSFPDGIEGKPHINLQGINMERLLRRGVRRENVRLHPGCTCSTKKTDGSYLYQSYRRDGVKASRILTCICLTK